MIAQLFKTLITWIVNKQLNDGNDYGDGTFDQWAIRSACPHKSLLIGNRIAIDISLL